MGVRDDDFLMVLIVLVAGLVELVVLATVGLEKQVSQWNQTQVSIQWPQEG